MKIGTQNFKFMRKTYFPEFMVSFHLFPPSPPLQNMVLQIASQNEFDGYIIGSHIQPLFRKLVPQLPSDTIIFQRWGGDRIIEIFLMSV